MKLLNSTDPDIRCPETVSSGSVVTIGNFDGFHSGHQSLVRETLRQARIFGLESVALSFEPHPAAYFSGILTKANLFTREQKIRAFSYAKIDALLIQSFNEKFSNLSAEDFWFRVLLDTLNCRALVVGQDFRYGYKRQGDSRVLKKQTEQAGVQLTTLDPDCIDGEPISSSRVRMALAKGDIRSTIEFLGRPYMLEGEVVRGRQIGRTLGFPTMNLNCSGQILPANGVYACFARVEGFQTTGGPFSDNIYCRDGLPAVLNIGYRKSFPDHSADVIAELHIPDQKFPELYHQSVEIFLIDFIREEKKFDSLSSLKNQIKKDIATSFCLLGI